MVNGVIRVESTVSDANIAVPNKYCSAMLYLLQSPAYNTPKNLRDGYLLGVRWTHSNFAMQFYLGYSVLGYRTREEDSTWTNWRTVNLN